ncbi:hypothetical protein RZS08_19975, partial [Arthrospira platensis SPKY1]|nr:hypothetical protein [Arthrospira platensis SPKY1]
LAGDFTGVLAAFADALPAAVVRAANLVEEDFVAFVAAAAARVPWPVAAGWALPLARATEGGRVPAAADLPEVAVLVAGAFTRCLLSVPGMTGSLALRPSSLPGGCRTGVRGPFADDPAVIPRTESAAGAGATLARDRLTARSA